MVLTNAIVLLFFIKKVKCSSFSINRFSKFTANSNDKNNITSLLKAFKENYPVQYWKNCCFFTESDLENINTHWLKFKSPKKEHFYGLAILYLLIMVTGIIGNLTVIILYWRRKPLRTPANTLIMNLAISDLVMMCMIPLFLYNSFHFGPALGTIGCKLYGFLGGISGTVSICLLAAISFDRYYVIKYPATRQPSFTRIRTLVFCSWIYGAVFSVIPVFNIGLGGYVPEAYLVSCSFDYLTKKREIKIFILVFFVAAWVIPFILILFCYINIIQVVVSSENLMRKISFNDSRRHFKTKEKIKQEIKITIIVLLLIILWFIAWTPYSIVALLGIFNREDLITPLNSMIPALFCKTASCLDPYIYTLTHPKFKQELKRMFVKIHIKKATKCSITESGTNKHDLERNSVVEEMIVVDLGKYAQHPPLCRISGYEEPQFAPVNQPSWWARPSFNDSSSLANTRRLAKKMSLKGSGGNDHNK